MSLLRDMVRGVREDVASARARDLALQSTADAVLNAPGLHAVWAYRVAHAMWRRGGGWRLPARVVATLARAVTGIEIHPGASIGRRLYIDHGVGVVIGATAVVGDDVLMYHGATLGARDARDGRRHPIVGDGAMIGAGAKVLGPVLVGARARVGANAVVVHDVPAGATVVGVAAEVRERVGA